MNYHIKACSPALKVSLRFLLALCVVFGSITSHAAPLPGESDFQKVTIVTGLANAVDFEIAPDGRIFILNRYGEVRIFLPATNTTVLAADMDIYHGKEAGLLAIAFDPDFTNNNFIYLFYSPKNYTGNRVSRFRMDGNNLVLSSEIVMLQWPTGRGPENHDGGDMKFDKFGNLYIGTGDDTFHSKYAPLDEVDVAYSAEKSSSNTMDLRGKILRIKPNPDGSYSIPSGNLFPGGAGGRAEIYVMGARNPYKFSIDSVTNWLFWGDIGPDANTDGPDGPQGKDEINLTKQAGNYGWPYFIGPNLAYRNTYLDYWWDPAAPTNDSVWNTGPRILPPAQSSWIAPKRAAYMAGPVYHFDPSILNSKKLPQQFDGHFFYWDFNTSRMWYVEFDASGNILNNQLWDPTVISGMGFIDAEIGPDGQMYILEYGTGCCAKDVGNGVLTRLDYIGAGGNLSPVAQASADPRSGSLPLLVNFSSAGSFDPDGTIASYAWDFDTDGIIDSFEPNPSFTYTQKQTVNAQLRVTDNNNAEGVANVTIHAGNNAADINFLAPAEGGTFGWGETINFEVEVNDIEDGSTSDGGILCSDVNVLPALGHLSHAHDDPEINNCIGSYDVSIDHGTEAPTELYVTLTGNYTDRDGLQTFHVIRLNPKKQGAAFYQRQNGTQLVTNTDSVVEAEDAVRGTQNNAYIVFEKHNLQNIDSIELRVASNQTGGSIEIRADSETGTLLGSAVVPNTGGFTSWMSIIVPISDPGGLRDLYFIFKGTGTDLFDLSTILFTGAGVSVRTPPRLDSIAVTPTGLTVDIGSSLLFTASPLDQYGETYETAVNWSVSGGGSIDSSGLFTASLPGGPFTVSAESGGVSGSATVSVVDPTVDPNQNLALNKPAIASSVEKAPFTPDQAFDGDGATRWSSKFSDPQWIQVDLESVYSIDRVVLNWERAASLAYQIEVSLDGVGWTSVYATTAGNGGIDDLGFAPVAARYVRMVSTQRATKWGVSLWEFEVYAASAPAPDTVTITSPSDGEQIAGSDVLVTYTVTGSTYDHLHLTLDSQPHIKITDLTGSYLLTNVPVGPHTITAQLVNSGHIPLGNPEASNTVNINVLGNANQPPIAINDSATVLTGGSVIIDVLSNDSDADGTLDASSLVLNQPSSGTVVDNGNGIVTYTHNGSATLVDSFTYSVSDDQGASSNVATVSILIGSLATGPMAHWPMNEGTGTSTADTTGNGFDGTLVNGPLWAADRGLSFDGVDDYVDVGMLDVAGNEVTLTAWFRADNLSNCSARDCRIIAKASGDAENDHYMMVSTIKSGTTATRLRFRLKAGGVTTTLIAGSGDLQNNQWVHVAAVYDGTSMTLYKDGVNVGSTPKSGTITTNSSVPMWIGGSPSGATVRPWDGQIDDVTIYSRALSAAEIAAMVSNDTAPPVISNVQASVTDGTATITWDTDEPASSVVNYGLDATYGSVVNDAALVISHSVTLSGLAAETQYHFQVVSVDGSGNQAAIADTTFTTAAQSGEPPVLTTITVSPASATVNSGATRQFTATTLDQFGNPISATPVWSVSGGGNIDASGLFNASTAGGPFIVTAQSAGISGTATVSVVDSPVGILPLDSWQAHSIDEALPWRGIFIDAADLDGDSLKDIVTGGWWYKNPGVSGGTWVRNDIGAPLNNMMLIHDFDNDGDYDILGTDGAYQGTNLLWAENDGTGSFILRDNVQDGTSSYREPFAAGVALDHFDGTSDYQLAIQWNGGESGSSAVQILNIPSENTAIEPWTISNLHPDSLGEALSSGDIDRDGDPDLFQGSHWLRNDGATWSRFQIATFTNTVDRSGLADINGNGRLDAVVGFLENNTPLLWLEAPQDPTQEWAVHTIAASVGGGLSIGLADMDNDGDIDVVLGEHRGAKRLIIYENLGGGSSWKEHIIHPGGLIDHHDGAVIVDIDNDGDLDILSLGWNTLKVYLFENKAIDNPATGSPLTVLQQPADQTVTENNVATFSIAATGTGPITYQWRMNGLTIPDATSSTYSLVAALSNDGDTIDCIVSDDVTSVASESATLNVLPQTPSDPGSNLALNKPASASSVEGAAYSPANAFDGNAATRWSSNRSDPQWLSVDLQSVQSINRVVLNWERAYSNAYRIEVSQDGVAWTSVYSTITGGGGVEDISFASTAARYVRLYSTQRATKWGVSLWEFEVYGAGN
jgi:glucose/arabinose dehydrogenase